MAGAKGRGNLVAGLDIGTSKIAAMIGEVGENGRIALLGVGTNVSRGLKRGVVIDVESTVASIRNVVVEAETMAGRTIRSVCVGIAGAHIAGRCSLGVAAIRDGEVAPRDMARANEAARAVPVGADRRVLHTLPQTYIVDERDRTHDPLGMSGVRLESRVYIVTGAMNAFQNIVNCVHRSGLEVDDIVLEQLASSQSVLTDDEKDSGVCLVDIGGGTTDMAIFCNGVVRHVAVIPIAGAQVTSDIALGLRTSISHAEEIKLRYGCARVEDTSAHETIEVPVLGDRPPRRCPRRDLAEVIGPRCQELLELVREQIRAVNLEGSLPAGIVLTGGSARLEGLLRMAEDVFGMPVRLGCPDAVTGLEDRLASPVYATAAGLLMFASPEAAHHPGGVRLRPPRRLFGRMREWVHSGQYQ